MYNGNARYAVLTINGESAYTPNCHIQNNNRSLSTIIKFTHLFTLIVMGFMSAVTLHTFAADMYSNPSEQKQTLLQHHIVRSYVVRMPPARRQTATNYYRSCWFYMVVEATPQTPKK